MFCLFTLLDKRKKCYQSNSIRNVITLFFISSFSFGSTHARHWIPTKTDIVHHVPTDPVLSGQSPEQNMRFHVTYDQSLQRLNVKRWDLIVKKLIPEALGYFHKALKVHRSRLPIKLQHMCRDHSYFLKDSSGKHKGNLLFCKKECVRTHCGPVIIPREHLDQCRVCNEHGSACGIDSNYKRRKNKGINNKDFVLYVSSLQTRHCEETKAVAYASYCQQEHSLDRPIAGFANICPNELQDDSRHYPSLLATMKHEIFHALGFSAGLYAFYRDHLGRPLTTRDTFGLPRYNNVTNLYQWSNRVVKTIEREDWETMHGSMKHEIQMIVTPRVKREVRRHFRCSSLEGAEIENQGPAGTKWTHWEKRLFENEAMTGTYTQNPVFSRITLGLMEDTGWYKVNYKTSEDLDWGKKLGCLFAKRSCRSWMKTRLNKNESPVPFCFQTKQTPLHTRCTHSKDAIALCNLQKYSKSLPTEYQYFNHLTTHDSPKHFRVIKDTKMFGGSVRLADYCPFYQKFTLKKSPGNTRETSCVISENGPSYFENYALESYGKESKCVEQARQWTAQKGQVTRTMLDWGSGCYKYSCANNRLYIVVGEKRYVCPKQHHIVHINGTLDKWFISGSLRCPSCEELCSGRCSKSWSLESYTPLQDAQLAEETYSGNNAKNGISKPSTKIGYLTILALFILQ